MSLRDECEDESGVWGAPNDPREGYPFGSCARIVNERFNVVHVTKTDDDLALQLGGYPPKPPEFFLKYSLLTHLLTLLTYLLTDTNKRRSH